MAVIDSSIMIRKGFAATLKFFSILRRGRLPAEVRSIAILAPECYGDCILLTCLLQQLRAEVPGISIHLVTFRRSTSRFFADDPNIASVFYVKSGLPSWIRYVMTHRFDVLFSPKDSLSFSFLLQGFLLRASYKVAHRHAYHERIFDRLIDMDYYERVIVRNAGLLGVLGLHDGKSGGQCVPYLPPMPVRDEVNQFSRKILDEGVIGINLSAGFSSKRWSREKWSALISRFPEHRFVIFCAPEDASEKQLLESTLSNITPSPSTANLGEVGQILKSLRFLVTPDTSLVHVAACYDLPVVALYRNVRADIERFPPMSTACEQVISPDAPIGAITVDAVGQAVARMIDRLAPEAISG